LQKLGDGWLQNLKGDERSNRGVYGIQMMRVVTLFFERRNIVHKCAAQRRTDGTTEHK
jgi:hypothetical protein